MDNNLVDIIKSIIAQINLELKVLSIDVDIIYLCNTLHLTIGKIVKDSDDNEYKVIELSINEYVKVEPINHIIPFSGATLTAPEITYLHGDPLSTNAEYKDKGQRTSSKTPFIWLVESYTYDDLPKDSITDAAYNVRLFFMDWANTPKWVNDEHNEYVIKPMENLQTQFKQIIEDDSNYKRLENLTVSIRPRFGNVPDRPQNLIIDEDLSGVEMNFKLEVYESDLCCGVSEVVDVCSPAVEHIEDTDGNNLYSDLISSGESNTRTIQDATETLNGDEISGLLAEGTKAITLKDDLGATVNPTILVDNNTNLDLEIPSAVTPLNTADLIQTGQTVSFLTNDDGDLEFGRTVNFFTLAFNNGFGNPNRFTDDLGTQIYASDVVVDWSTWNRSNSTVLCYYRVPNAISNVTNLMAGQPYTRNSIGGWYIPNIRQLQNIQNWGVFRNPLNYAPFNYVYSATSDRLWTSTGDASTTYVFTTNVGTSLGNFSALYKSILSRTYTLAELGL